MRALLLTCVAMGLLQAGRARAQACTSCSPLALPTQATLGVGATSRSPWVVLAQVTGGWLSYPGQTIDGRSFEDPNQARVDFGLLSLQASAQHRSGAGVEVVLPGAILTGTDVLGTRTDPGLGDLEARGRFLGRPTPALTLLGSGGVALPTGRYSARSGELALGDGALALTPGRGVLWGLLEGELRWAPHPRVSTSVAVAGRLPLTSAFDGFSWGSEVRSVVGAEVSLLPERLSVGLGAEVQWRGVSSLVDPFVGARVDSGNTGGVGVTLLPSVTVQLPAGFFATASLRVSALQRLAGLQFTPGLGAFLGIGIAIPVGEVRQAQAAATGQWQVRHFAADWCKVCHALAPQVEALRASRPQVRFEALDVTAWTQEELEAAAPGAQQLPIVEIRRPDGSLATRLEGQAALSLEAHLSELLQ